jgi:hypothetical protein
MSYCEIYSNVCDFIIAAINLKLFLSFTVNGLNSFAYDKLETNLPFYMLHEKKLNANQVKLLNITYFQLHKKGFVKYNLFSIA